MATKRGMIRKSDLSSYNSGKKVPAMVRKSDLKFETKGKTNMRRMAKK